MLTKFLIAVILMLVGWMLMRHISPPRHDVPAKSKPKPRKAASRQEEATTLERDPDTGVYH